MATVSRIDVYPIKSLDGETIDRVPVVEGGRIAYDREYALFDEDGDYINGKNNDFVFPLRSRFDIETRTVTLTAPTGKTGQFDIEDDGADLNEWLSGYFGEPTECLRAKDRNFNDSSGGMAPMKISAPGPTIVSTATLKEVASWFDDLTMDDIRRRLRTNIEISGTDPFWEDRLFSDKNSVVEFEIGDVTLRGIMPKPRCRVPTIDPDSGERHEDFLRVFTEKRKEKFPDWADADYLGQHLDLDVEHYYYLTVVTRIPRTQIGSEIRVGDEISVLGETATYKIL